MDIIKSYKKENTLFRICVDPCPERPEMYGHIFHWHPRYDLGKRIKPAETKKNLQTKDWAQFLNLYLFDHGELILSITPFNDQFDSGQVGYVGVTREEFNNHIRGDEAQRSKGSIARVQESLERFSMYLNGSVFYWTKTVLKTCSECGHTSEGDIIHDCGGYYGIESWDQMMADAGVDESWEEVSP